jgi:hypothetical protein
VAALVAGAVDLDRVRGDQAPGAFDISDLASLDQPLQTLVQPADDAVLVRVDGLEVDTVQCDLHAELFCLARQVSHFARVQQRLGRYAASV